MQEHAKVRRGRPSQENKEALERKLLDAALDEFLTHGYGGASLTRIVKRIGISKTTLYSRYSGKEALFHAIISDQMEQFSPSGIFSDKDGLLGLREGLIAYGKYALHTGLHGKLRYVDKLIYSESAQFPELANEAARRTERGIQRVGGFIADCLRTEGVVCRDPEAVASLYLFSIRGWSVNTIMNNRTVSQPEWERWVERIVDVLLSDRKNW